MSHADNCPNCGVTWWGAEIPDGLLAHSKMIYRTREDAEKAAAHYGWTKMNKKCFSENVVGVETQDYDGVSYWLCQNCGIYINRWTGKPVEGQKIF